MTRAIILLLSGWALAAAQAGQVDVVVAGRDGHRVASLKAGDFEVFQDGKARQITQFSYVEAEPQRTLVVVVDDLAMDAADFVNVRTALTRFFDTELRSGDRVSLVYVSHGSGALRQLTSDGPLLRHALEGMYWHPSDAATVMLGDLPLQRTVRALLADLVSFPGRKAMVIAAPGKRRTQSLDVRSLAEMAGAASTVIYGIEAHAVAGTALSALAAATGGLSVRDSEATFDQLREAVAPGYYLIGWNGAEVDSHRIQIRARDKKLQVRARDGLLSEPVPASPHDALRRALVSPLRSGDLDVRLTSVFVSQEAAGSYIDLFLHIAPKGVRFEQNARGCWSARLEVARALVPLDPGLAPSDRVNTSTVEWNGCADAADRARHDGLTASVRERVPLAGGHQVRVAVRNAGESAIGSATEFLMIPALAQSPVALSGLTIWSGDDTPAAGADVACGPAADGDAAVRRFSSRDKIRYAFQVFGSGADVQVTVLRDGREVLKADGGSLTGLAAGNYVLHVAAIKGRERADQYLDFEMR